MHDQDAILLRQNGSAVSIPLRCGPNLLELLSDVMAEAACMSVGLSWHSCCVMNTQQCNASVWPVSTNNHVEAMASCAFIVH